jgi:hypothetical protein
MVYSEWVFIEFRYYKRNEIWFKFKPKWVIQVFYKDKYTKEIINNVGNDSSLDYKAHNNFLQRELNVESKNSKNCSKFQML